MDAPDTTQPKKVLRMRSGYLIPVVLLVIVLWIFRPWIHPFLMLFYTQPLYLISLVLIWLLPKVVRPNGGKTTFKILTSQVVLFILIWGLIGSFGNDLAMVKAGRTISFAPRTVFPEVSALRLLPKEVASRYAVDSLQNSQEKLGDSQIVYVDGILKRVFPRIPDGGLLYFLKPLSGFITIDTTQLDRKSTTIDQKFAYSEGVGLLHNVYFQLAKKKYWVTYSEPIYLQDPVSKHWVTVVPYISYHGFPLRVPEWGGFMTIESDGTITDHTPEEASTLALTKGNSVYPKELARYYANSYSFKNGLLNIWFIHKDQSVIDDLDSSPQPFHIPTVEGYKQIIVSRPVGSSFGIFKLFIIDATTGKREIIEYNQNTQLTGPVAAVDYVKKAYPSIDYNSFTIAEPRPLAVQGKLYWLLSIINSDSAGVAHTVLVNAETTDVTQIDNPAEIKAFITSGQTIEKPTTETPAAAQGLDQVQQQIEALQKQLDDLHTSVVQLKSTPSNKTP